MNKRAILLTLFLTFVLYSFVTETYLVQETKVFPGNIPYLEFLNVITFELILLVCWIVAVLISASLIPNWITVKNKTDVNINLEGIKEDMKKELREELREENNKGVDEDG